MGYKGMEAGFYRTTVPACRCLRTGFISLAAIVGSPLAGRAVAAAAGLPHNDPAAPLPSELTFNLNDSVPCDSSSLLRLTDFWSEISPPSRGEPAIHFAPLEKRLAISASRWPMSIK